MSHLFLKSWRHSARIIFSVTVLGLPLLMTDHPAIAQSTICYEVADPDGWVNVRDRQTGEVVAQIDNGSRFWSSERTSDNMVVLDAPHNMLVISPKRLKQIRSGKGCTPYVVFDRDGFVNLRESPNGSVIGTVNDGDTVIVVGRSAVWWRILTSDGRTGFVHSSRLR
jgi:hypothetical protein